MGGASCLKKLLKDRFPVVLTLFCSMLIVRVTLRFLRLGLRAEENAAAHGTFAFAS